MEKNKAEKEDRECGRQRDLRFLNRTVGKAPCEKVTYESRPGKVRD